MQLELAQVDHVELLLDLPRLVTVAAVQEELEAGAETHLYIKHALAILGEEIPVITPSVPAQKLEEQLLESLDSDEAQALAIAEVADGMIVTDDGDARTTAKQRVYEELGGDPAADEYPSGNIPYPDGFEEGWIVVAAELDYANPLVSTVMDEARRFIANETDRDEDLTEKADTALVGLAAQLLDTEEADTVSFS